MIRPIATRYTHPMCGRYTLTDPAEMQTRFGFVELHATRIPPVVPSWNVAPTQQVPMVVEGADGRRLALARWGFQPAWMRDGGKRAPPINAKAETLLERPMFRGAVARGRCVLPADGFYEWAVVPGTKGKQPWYFRLEGGGVFGFAALYAEGRDGDATCCIITTEPNALVAPVHDRMPVLLLPEHEDAWLDPSVTDPLTVLPYLGPYPEERMEAYPVSTAVNAARHDGPELIRPLLTS